MRLDRASKTKLALVALSVCGASFLAGALAMRSAQSEAARSTSESEAFVETLTEGSASASTNSLSNLFGFATPEKKARIAKALARAAKAAVKADPKTAQATPLSQAWKQSTVRLKYLDRCVQSQSCEAFGQQSPDDYYLETRLAQAAEVLEFKKVAIEWRDTYGGPNLPQEALDITNHFLKTGDDYVKDAALEIAEITEPTLSERDALIKALMDSGSGPLFEKALKGALLKYKGDAAVDRMLLYQAARGATKVQSAIAMHSLPYLSAENQGLFEIIASKKNQRSMEAAYWRANFAEKDRMNEGG